MTTTTTPEAAAEHALVEKVKQALQFVPSVWHRMDNWTSDCVPGKPYQICCCGSENEDEIVVLGAFATQAEADEAQIDKVLELRARAALAAARPDGEREAVVRHPWGERMNEVATIIAKATGTYHDLPSGGSKPQWAFDAARAVCAHYDAIEQGQHREQSRG